VNGIAAAGDRVGAGRHEVILFGVLPSTPERDYGWILPAGQAAVDGLVPVASFVEKPDAATATRLFESGAVWNTMVLVSRAATLLKLYCRHLPDVADAFIYSLRFNRPARQEFLRAQYEMLPSTDFSRDLLGHALGCSCRHGRPRWAGPTSALPIDSHGGVRTGLTITLQLDLSAGTDSKGKARRPAFLQCDVGHRQRDAVDREPRPGELTVRREPHPAQTRIAQGDIQSHVGRHEHGGSPIGRLDDVRLHAHLGGSPIQEHGRAAIAAGIATRFVRPRHRSWNNRVVGECDGNTQSVRLRG
jgi:hypothetical protein